MIIVDYGSLSISNLFAQIKNHTNIEIEKTLLRHMVINSLRALKMRFGSEYGELIVACDSKASWRKEIFPYYKANRRKDRDSSELDWPKIFGYFTDIRNEMTESLPYRIIHVEGAEADDIIGTLTLENRDFEKILIVSNDKDFRQLHHENVKQWDMINDVFIEVSDPKEFLKEHIIRGDSTDGIPSCMSPDNCLVLGIRQKPVTKKRLEQFKNGDFPDDTIKSYWERNKILIDLTMIPKNIVDNILSVFESQRGKTREKLINYFMTHKLKDLSERLSDF